MNITMKECVKLAAALAGIDELPPESFDECASLSEQQQKLTELLVTCGNLVVSELATEFLPLHKKQTLAAEQGFIPFSALAERVIDVISVSRRGKKQNFTLRTDGINTDAGDADVEYTYLPQRAGLDGSLAYSAGRLTSRTVALGIAAEYCLISGNYSEALRLDKRYKDSLLAASRRKNYALPARRWA